MNKAELLNLLKTLVPTASGSRSFVGEDEPHFKGNPLYVLKEGRYHLAHPDPVAFHDHLDQWADGDGRGHFKVFGWERQAHDGTPFGNLDDKKSAAFADTWGVANPDELRRRLTAGMPDLQDAPMTFELSEGGDTDAWENYVYDLSDQHDGDLSYEGDGQIMRRIEPDEDDEDGEATEEYLDLDTNEWGPDPVENLLYPTAKVHIAHPILGTMTRSLHSDYEGTGVKTAYNDYWAVGNGTKGGKGNSETGMSGLIYQSQMEAYRAAGVEEVKVHANIDVGGYAWARHGFEPDDLDEMQSWVKDKLDDVHADYGSATDDFDPDEMDQPLEDQWAEHVPHLDPKTATDAEINDAADEAGVMAHELIEHAANVRAGLPTDDKLGAKRWQEVMEDEGRLLSHYDGPTQVKEALEERDKQIDRDQANARSRQTAWAQNVKVHDDARQFREANPDRQAWVDAQVRGQVSEEDYAQQYADMKAKETPKGEGEHFTREESHQIIEGYAHEMEHGYAQDAVRDMRAHLARLDTLAEEGRREYPDYLKILRRPYNTDYVNQAYPQVWGSEERTRAIDLLKRYPTSDDLTKVRMADTQEEVDRVGADAEKSREWLRLFPDHTTWAASTGSANRTPEAYARQRQNQEGAIEAHARLLEELANEPVQSRLAYEKAEALAASTPDIPERPADYSGPQKTTHADDDAIIRHWITTMGWEPGQESGFSDDQLEEMKDEVDGMNGAELAAFTLSDDLGVPDYARKVGMRALLGSDWYGTFQLDSPSASSHRAGSAYRASKIKAWASHEAGTPLPEPDPKDPVQKLLGNTPLSSIPSATMLYGHVYAGGRTPAAEDVAEVRRRWENQPLAALNGHDQNEWARVMSAGVGTYPQPSDFDAPGEVADHAQIVNNRLLTADELHALHRHFHAVTGNGFNGGTATVAHTPATAYTRMGNPTTFRGSRQGRERQDIRPLADQHLDALTRDADSKVWQAVYGDRHPRSFPNPAPGMASVQQRVQFRNDAKDAGLTAEGAATALQRQHERHHLLGTLPTPESDAWGRWFDIPGQEGRNRPDHTNITSSPRGDFLNRMIDQRRGLTQYPLDERPGDVENLHRHAAQASVALSGNPPRIQNQLSFRAITGSTQTKGVTEADLRREGKERGLSPETVEAAVKHLNSSG